MTEQKTAHYGLWGAVLAALITGAIGLYIHYDGKSEQKKNQELEKKADQSKDTANLTISNVYLTPINTSIDSVFFAEVTNNSLNVAKNLIVKLDFGEATISKCEITPSNAINKNETFTSSIVSFSVEELERKDTFYIYCFISHPVFKSLLITGSNLFSNEQLNYKNYHPIKTDEESGFLTFFKVIASIVSLVFVIYFVIVVINFLNKKFKL